MKIFKRSVLLVTISIVLMVLLAACQPQESKIGVIDMEAVVNNSLHIQNYQEALNQKLEELQFEYDSKLEEIDDQELLEQTREEAYIKSQEIRNELELEAKNIIQKAIEEVAQEKELEIVLRKSEIHYGGIDITEQVLESL